ncbi:MAG TPA: GFA family protein [Usitatibacteraceae bacterium]|nr:GFA family protein [Usitatibacteraceae bacterium]
MRQDISPDDRLDGGCTCRFVRFRLSGPPMFVHACHCTWCQRETGTAFALNAIYERDRVQVLEGEAEVVVTPSESGRGQKIARCPRCRIALWSSYSSPAFAFVRVGTLDDPKRLPPDVHIFTRSKQPWFVVPPGQLAVEAYYDPEKTWPAESLARRHAARTG